MIRPRALGAAAALGVTLAATAALAYELVSTKGGIATHWTRACVPWWLHEGPVGDLPREEGEAALREAFERWNRIESSFVRFQARGATCVEDSGADARLGRENVLVFREAWPAGYARNVVALTSLTFDSQSGVILDADVEFNAERYAFATGGEPFAYDVELVMMHEAGHMVGLDHSQVPGAVMNRDALPGERAPEALHADDVAGVSQTHPADASPGGECDPAAPVAALDDPHCPRAEAADDGCAGAQGSAAPLLWAAAALLSPFALRRRRRRSRP